MGLFLVVQQAWHNLHLSTNRLSGRQKATQHQDSEASTCVLTLESQSYAFDFLWSLHTAVYPTSSFLLSSTELVGRTLTGLKQ